MVNGAFAVIIVATVVAGFLMVIFEFKLCTGSIKTPSVA